MDRFDEKVVLVTGAASGIGRAAALRFAREGARVVAVDVDESGVAAADEIKTGGGRAIFVRADVASPADTKAMVEKAVQAFGRLDAAFNNAGIEGTAAETADLPPEAWERVLRVNLTGTWLCMRAEIPALLARKGAIVNMASILGLVGYASASAYVASKHGIVGLTRAAALEYAGRGLRINAVCPGFIETPMLRRGGILDEPEVRRQVTALHPLNRLGKPDEVAAAVAWLCSDEAAFVTGAALPIDGGYTAR